MCEISKMREDLSFDNNVLSSDENLNPILIHDGVGNGTEILTNGIEWYPKLFYFKFSNEQNFILFTNTIFKLTFYKI